MFWKTQDTALYSTYIESSLVARYLVQEKSFHFGEMSAFDKVQPSFPTSQENRAELLKRVRCESEAQS
jgi:hypothetical protein